MVGNPIGTNILGELRIVPLSRDFPPSAPIYGLMMDVGKPSWENQVYLTNGDVTVRLHLRSGIKGVLVSPGTTWANVSSRWFPAGDNKFFTLYNDPVINKKVDVLYFDHISASSWQDGHVFFLVR